MTALALVDKEKRCALPNIQCIKDERCCTCTVLVLYMVHMNMEHPHSSRTHHLSIYLSTLFTVYYLHLVSCWTEQMISPITHHATGLFSSLVPQCRLACCLLFANRFLVFYNEAEVSLIVNCILAKEPVPVSKIAKQ